MRVITEESLRHVMKMHDMNDSETSLIFSHLFNECTELNAWQPIETAPKDKPLLIRFNDAYLEVARLVNGVWISNDGLDYCYGQDTPTHWQELPEDPK